MHLTIDAGNTFAKVIVFEDTVPVYRKIFNRLTVKDIDRIFTRYKPGFSMLSSVINIPRPVMLFLRKQSNFSLLNSKTRLPIKNGYATPATLGNDRLANAVAAAFLFPKENVLVVDAGTCVKYDFVNS